MHLFGAAETADAFTLSRNEGIRTGEGRGRKSPHRRYYPQWATVIEVEPPCEVLSSELDSPVESFVAELIEHSDAIASVAGWSPLVRGSARRLAAARAFTEQPTVERKPGVRESQVAQRLRLGYRG